MATRRIQEFLDGSSVRYVTVGHSTAYTAEETARSSHIPADLMAKTVIVRIDGRLAMVVVPAAKDIDLNLLQHQVGAAEVKLAHEPDFVNRFAGCQLGTVPPFGNLFGVETFIDRELTHHAEIAFTAGTHTDVIIMRLPDYLRLARPSPVQVSVAPAGTKLRETENQSNCQTKVCHESTSI